MLWRDESSEQSLDRKRCGMFRKCIPKLAEASISSSNTFADPGPGDQVAAICYRETDTGVEYCFIKSSSGKRIFPKGKVEKGERPWDSAAREAKEEAGVLGTIDQHPLTTFEFERPKRGSRELVTAYLLRVVVSEGTREKGRNPKWWGFDRALEKLSKKKQSANSDELSRVLREAHEVITGSNV